MSEDRVPAQAAPVPSVAELTRVVAVDGPAGSGKTTVARAVAAALGWRFVDTGATYRAVTLAVLQESPESRADADGAGRVAQQARVELSTDPSDSWVRLNGADVTAEIRTAEVTAAVSEVSAVPAVRRVLIDLQRRAMGTEGAVVEGRDIATVVAPLAAVKVYLDASPEVRARRRAGEIAQGASSQEADPDETERAAALQAAVARALADRDALDHQTNKLQASDGAVHLDTSELTINQVVTVIVALVEGAGLITA